jgi:hypothetical protein
MTEEVNERGIPKVEDSDLTSDEFVLARDLIRYHRHAFDVRCSGILPAEVDPPEIRELVNMLIWLGRGYNVFDQGRHILALSEIVSNNARESRKMIEYMRANGADARAIADLQTVQMQMEAADTLMGYLVDG